MTRAKVEWWDRLGLSPKKYWAAFKVTKDALLFPGTNIKHLFQIYFRNHMLHENEAILRKSIFDEKKSGETLETYLKF